MSEMDEEKRDAINRLAHASAPLMWASTGQLPQAVYLAESYIKHLQEDRDILLQAMWDAREALGFDTDGDSTFHVQRDRRGVEMVARGHVDEAKEIRKDYDDALEPKISAVEVNRLAQRFYEASDPRLPIAMTDKPKIVEGLTAVLRQLGYEVTS